MEWLIGVACSAPEAKWSPTQAAKSCAASQQFIQQINAPFALICG